MAQRLPIPGQDDNTWGDILNGFLGVAHNTDGTIATGVITTTQILDGTITTTDISPTAAIVSTQLSSAVQTSLGKADAAAVDTAVVHLANSETVNGIKTFNLSPIVPTPTTPTQAANKSYVDSATVGMTRTVAAIAAATTAGATAKTDYIYYWSGSSAFTLTMPTAASNTNLYTLKNASTISQTVATTASQTIEGGTSITISPNNSVDLISNGSNWMVI